MIRKVYDKPRGVLPRATGLPDMELKLGKRTKRDLLSRYSILGYFYKRAITNHGITQFEYTEENGYEYERRATYNEATNTIITNDIACPVAYGHHIGSTCSMCGQKD